MELGEGAAQLDAWLSSLDPVDHRFMRYADGLKREFGNRALFARTKDIEAAMAAIGVTAVGDREAISEGWEQLHKFVGVFEKLDLIETVCARQSARLKRHALQVKVHVRVLVRKGEVVVAVGLLCSAGSLVTCLRLVRVRMHCTADREDVTVIRVCATDDADVGPCRR